jgi:hypothetical protein
MLAFPARPTGYALAESSEGCSTSTDGTHDPRLEHVVEYSTTTGTALVVRQWAETCRSVAAYFPGMADIHALTGHEVYS